MFRIMTGCQLAKMCVYSKVSLHLQCSYKVLLLHAGTTLTITLSQAVLDEFIAGPALNFGCEPDRSVVAIITSYKSATTLPKLIEHLANFVADDLLIVSLAGLLNINTKSKYHLLHFLTLRLG